MQTQADVMAQSYTLTMREHTAPSRFPFTGTNKGLTNVGPARIGLALGGGFACGIAHAGVLRVLKRYRIPLHCVTGISAGAVMAAAYASGAFGGRYCPRRLLHAVHRPRSVELRAAGVGQHPADESLSRRSSESLSVEEMRIPLGVIATDLSTGEPAPFAAQAACSNRSASVAPTPDCSSRWAIQGGFWWIGP